MRIGLTVCVLLMLRPARAEDAPQPEMKRLRSEVVLLASPEFAGRRHEGGEKTAAHLVQAFRELKLEPLFNGDYLQPIPPAEPGRISGRNVGARLIGADPTKRDEWVILSAHFDHLGVRNGVLYPGADDNASGVAMMLEVARSIVQSKEAPRRSLMFIGFDLEEVGLYGSRYFVEHSPVPLSRIALFLTADMIGRSLGGICPPYVFVMGSEHAPGLRPWLGEAADGKPINLGVLGSDVLLLDRSDYGPFRARHIPYLFFSTGENPCYHTPNDIPETLDYPKLEAISRLIHEFVRKTVSADSLPAWNPAPDNPIAEAVTVRTIMRTLLENRESLKIGSAQLYMMSNTLRRLDTIIARGSITAAERSGMVNVARIVLLSLF